MVGRAPFSQAIVSGIRISGLSLIQVFPLTFGDVSIRYLGNKLCSRTGHSIVIVVTAGSDDN